MSAIGEAIGFARTARRIAEQLRTDKTPTADGRAKLENDLRWYDDEARFCRSAARQEVREDAARDHDRGEED